MICADVRSGSMTGYFACVHVMENGAIPVHIIEPSGPGPKRAGELFCAMCVEREKLVPDELRIVCARCARLYILPMRIH